MKLSSRILLIAAVNLALLAGLFLVFARLQLHAEFGSFLFAATRDRVLSVGRELALDLEHTAVSGRDELVNRYARTYGVKMYLFEGRGDQVAGETVVLPDEVIRELQRRPPDDERPPPRPRSEDDDRRPPPPPRRNDTFEVYAAKQYWVGVRIPFVEPGEERPVPGTLLMSASSFFGTALFFDFKPWLAVVMAVIVVFLICWVPFIRSLTRTISRVTAATETISQGNFELHLPEDRRDELGQLSAAINRMSGRLSGFVMGQKRFLGDIAHELCAPIARIQFGLGILEQRAEPALLQSVEDVQDEMRQMSALVGELLSFSKAGMESGRKPLVKVDVAQVIRVAVEREGAGADVCVDAGAGVSVMADADSLLRALSNLIRNAVRYAGGAGPITVSTQRQNGDVVISVADSGPGIPPDELDHVFRPFYRPEASRNRESGGTGLGLSIVKGCVEACHGRVVCANRHPSGLEVTIRLKSA